MFGRYLELTKPKVTLLNLLVAATCFILAAYPALDLSKLAVFCLIGYLAAGGCGVLNSAYDHDIDRLMPRTSKRAVPAGYVSVKTATALGTSMLAISFAVAYFFFNPLTALMIGFGSAFYIGIYTIWLKRISPWNVVIGGFAGCFAALSGWTAVANTLSLTPLIISMLDFLWTPGHLWGLAIKKVKEYRKAGVPMLPVKVGIVRTARVVLLLNALTVAFSLMLPLLQLAGALYTLVALGAGVGFLLQNRGLLFSASESYGFKVFAASMPYLACLMAALILDKIF